MKQIVQGSLFEDDYLVRTVGNIARDPDYALTELVANAWDAGATKVEIVIPSEAEEVIRISDNGTGMTGDQFKQRWMTLGYKRARHQGKRVEFPPGVDGGNRVAYGRNGIGRHAMLCFCDGYTVRTKRDGRLSVFEVGLSSDQYPFVITSENASDEKGYGTTVEGPVQRNLPDPDAIRESISARFIHDPRFVISVNRATLSLATHPGAEQPVKLTVPDCGEIEAIIVDTQKSARTKQKQGFAFWVQGRLVGEPSWTLGNSTPIDARTTFGRRFTILIKCDCMESELEPDWSGFRKGEMRGALYDVLTEFALKKYRDYSREKVDDTKRRAFEENLTDIRALSGFARNGVAEFVEAVVEREPTISSESLSTAVQAVINLQQTKSGQHLLKTLSSLPSDDVAALDKLLEEWSAQDALIVLDEIDRRIATIRAIELLSIRRDTDELHTLHPLVTEARWLFGPEFESSEYASNQSLKNAVNKVFGVGSSSEDYPNWRKRADLLMLAESTISAVALEEIDRGGLTQIRKVVIIELKKGDSKIGRKELAQAEEYVDGIRHGGHIPGHYLIHSFVVGSRVDPSVTLEKTLKAAHGVEHAEIRGVCYDQLTDTASKRLFKLKERLEDRYSKVSEGRRSSFLEELLAQQVLEFRP
jgi:Histidine kinase-, DNA gyrase B-, and HSP90-like ATPase